jgi:hypothetical protein
MRARTPSWIVATALAAALTAAPGRASADDVSPKGKGITGGALLGAEVVMLGEAAFGVRPAWAYLVGGAIGAGAAGYGGYLVEQDADPKASLYLLAGGMALAIPATVAVLQATSYQPPPDYTEDRPASSIPVAEPPRPGYQPGVSPQTPVENPPSMPGAPPPRQLHMRQWAPPAIVPTGLVHLDDGSSPRFAIPAVEVRPTFTWAELQRFGVEQHAELRLPLLSAAF